MTPAAPVHDDAPDPPSRRTRWGGAGRAGILVCAVLAAVLVAGLLLAVAAGQLAVARVMTGSMEPAVPAGSLVVGRSVGAADVRVGDVLTAHVPAAAGAVTHRVVALVRQDGRTHVRTRGDANAAPDPWTTSLPAAGATRVVATVPRLGEVLGRGPGGVPLLALPLLVLVLAWTGCSRLLALLRDLP